MSEFNQIRTVTDDAAHPLKVFEEARREIANANTVEQVNRIVALATGLAAAARKATDLENWLADRRQLSASAVVPANSDLAIPVLPHEERCHATSAAACRIGAEP
jgi:hypothetical protein